MNYKSKNQLNKIFFKKYLFASLLIMTISTSVFFAQDYRNPPAFQISIHPGLAYRAGSIGEYLFNKNGYGKEVTYAPVDTKQISFLQWDINAMIEASLGVDIQYKSFVAAVNGRVGLPMQVGKMEDYDWYSTKGHQTHFSTHINDISSHFHLEGLLGFEIATKNRQLIVVPMLGFTWKKTSMTAYEGYRQYVVPEKDWESTPWTDDIEKKYFEGKVISYAHEVFQINCVLRLTYNYNSKLFFNFDSSIHPIIGVYGFDTHFLKDTQYLDYNMGGQIGFGVAFSVGYQVIPRHTLILKFDFDYLPVVIGQTYSKYINQQYYYLDSSSLGGASHWFVGFSLGWRFNIFE